MVLVLVQRDLELVALGLVGGADAHDHLLDCEVGGLPVRVGDGEALVLVGGILGAAVRDFGDEAVLALLDGDERVVRLGVVGHAGRCALGLGDAVEVLALGVEGDLAETRCTAGLCGGGGLCGHRRALGDGPKNKLEVFGAGVLGTLDDLDDIPNLELRGDGVLFVGISENDFGRA